MAIFLIVGLLFVGCGDKNTITYKGRSIESWTKMLQAKSPKKKREAAIALKEIGVHAKKAVPFLRQALKDKHEHVRGTAAKALGEIRSKKAVPDLIKASKDKDVNVRIFAVQALGEIGSKKAVKALIESLKDKNTKVRIYAANALGDMHAKKAVPALEAALKNTGTREAAAIALGKIKGSI